MVKSVKDNKQFKDILRSINTEGEELHPSLISRLSDIYTTLSVDPFTVYRNGLCYLLSWYICTKTDLLQTGQPRVTISQHFRLLGYVEGKRTTLTSHSVRCDLTAEHHFRHVPTYWWDRKSEDDSADEPTRSDLALVSTTSLIVRPIGEIGRLRLRSSLTQISNTKPGDLVPQHHA